MDMHSTIERISPVECRVKVEIPWSDISGRLDTKMRELTLRAKLPGFRPGKVPTHVIERRFGRGIRQELANDLVEETFASAIAQHATIPLTKPVVEASSLEGGSPFTYAARFEVAPEVTPKDYVGVPIRRRPAIAEPAKVEAELKRLQDQLTELRPLQEGLERTETQPGDVWIVDVDGTLGAQRISRKDVRVDIGGGATELVPGLGEAMAGLKLAQVGTVLPVKFTPPQAKVRAEQRGQEANLMLGLRDVRTKHVPALDDDFARDTEQADSLEELKEKLANTAREEDAERAERDARQRLVQTLLERNPFDPAPSMIAREIAAEVDHTKRQLAQQGLKLSALRTTEGELAARIRPQATLNVRAFLLLDAIGRAENLRVDEAQFEEELQKMAEQSGQNVARMRASMDKDGQLLLLRAQLREQKILDFLMERAVVTEAPDPEETVETPTLE